jgi:NADP-dependent 3-hydroxy acid dehydrogenase YdfG
MTNFIEDKVIIVTGAASGFGRLVSSKAATLGARVVATDVNKEALKVLVSELEEASLSAIGIEADVCSRAQMNEVAQRAIDKYGRIDVILNNAGIMPLGFYSDHEQAADAWDKCIDINFRGVLNGITSVYDQMIAQGEGHVLNMSSIYGNYPVSGAAVYGATKAAVNFLSDSLRVESQGKIKVTTIRPTGVPGTALGEGIINPQALAGILGANFDSYMETFMKMLSGDLPDEFSDPLNIEYFALDPEIVADQILYAINQPLGVAISDLTVRASGDTYVI